MTEPIRPFGITLRVTGMILGPLQGHLRAYGLDVRHAPPRSSQRHIHWLIPGTVLHLSSQRDTSVSVADDLAAAIHAARHDLAALNTSGNLLLDPMAGAIKGALPNGQEVDLMTCTHSELLALMPELLTGSDERWTPAALAVDQVRSQQAAAEHVAT